MAKFIFNMQGLLNIKEKLEEQTKTEYGKALAKLEQEKSILLNLKNKKQENILSFRESINKGVKPNYIDNINKYISFIDKKESKKQKNILSFRESINNGVKPNYIDNINKYISLIDKKIAEQIQNIEKAKEVVEEKRLALLEAMKERKVLEALNEKEKENYFNEEIKKEHKDSDEIVSYKYNKA